MIIRESAYLINRPAVWVPDSHRRDAESPSQIPREDADSTCHLILRASASLRLCGKISTVRTISVKSHHREQLIDITSDVSELIAKEGNGVCVCFTQHTTCGMTINENADPDVQSDMLGFLARLIPQYEPNFRHFEHNSDAHIKSSLMGSSVTIPFENGKLLLGRWQGIYLCEFDGPREREIVVGLMVQSGSLS